MSHAALPEVYLARHGETAWAIAVMEAPMSTFSL